MEVFAKACQMDNAVTETIAQSADGLGPQAQHGMIHRPIADVSSPRMRCHTCQVMILPSSTALIVALFKMACAIMKIVQNASGPGLQILQLQNHGTMIRTQSAGVK